jgi:hypothetical protein
MRKLFYILSIVFLFASALRAQDMRTLFVGMPDSIVPILTVDKRADCVDFIDAGMKAKVTNLLDGKSELLQLTSDYLRMKMSSCSDMQMKLLPSSTGDTLICMVNTISAEARDSRIRFYTKGWAEVKNVEKLFSRPAIKDFFPSDTLLEKKLEISDIELIEYILSPSEPTLTARYTMPMYMSSGDSVFVTKGMNDILFRWNGKIFEKSGLR